MKIERSSATSVNKPDAYHKHSLTSARPFAPIAHAERPKEKRAIVLAQNPRRVQRVTLRIRAHIHVAIQGKQASFSVTTVTVNSQGALVLMEKNLPPETRFVLEHGQTRERVACRIGRPARQVPEGYHVPIEFDAPAPHFWGIVFPPSDWRPPE
ncbi:MAG TPA: hypothetical protein VEJ67_12380 [Candidatus Cybelea sp.]|nr:hypothetical protein [Candidatus Cybelea sp.]